LARNIANCNDKLVASRMTKSRTARRGKLNGRTCGVGKLVLLALYPVLQGLSIPTGDLDLLLNGFCVCVRHCECAMQAASMAVAAPGVVLVCGESRPESSGPAEERGLMQVARGGGIHDEWAEWEERAKGCGLSRRIGKEAADNAWGVVRCDEAGARDRSGGGGKGGGL
jgi:hypothetical protein